MTVLELIARYYSVIAHWAFTQDAQSAAVMALINTLPNFKWDSVNKVLLICDAEFHAEDFKDLDDSDEWESYFNCCLHDSEFAPYCLAGRNVDRAYVDSYRARVQAGLAQLTTEEQARLQEMINLVMDCLDTNYLVSES